MRNIVKCHVEECKYNNDRFCKKDLIALYGGVCSELIDKNGIQRNPMEWHKSYQQNKEKNI